MIRWRAVVKTSIRGASACVLVESMAAKTIPPRALMTRHRQSVAQLHKPPRSRCNGAPAQGALSFLRGLDHASAADWCLTSTGSCPSLRTLRQIGVLNRITAFWIAFSRGTVSHKRSTPIACLEQGKTVFPSSRVFDAGTNKLRTTARCKRPAGARGDPLNNYKTIGYPLLFSNMPQFQ